MPTITIVVNDKSYHTNTYIDSEAVHQAQVFLSPLSARILQCYLNKKNVLVTAQRIDLSIHNLYQSIQQTQKNSMNFGLARFLMAAVYVLESHISFDLPEYIWYVVTGKEDTYSLPTSNWQSLIYNVRHDINSQEKLTDQVANASNIDTIKSNPHLVVEIAKIFRNSSSSKTSKKLFVKKLEYLDQKLKDSHAPLNEKAIVGWLLSMTASHQVSSIQTYSNRITTRWLTLTENVNLKDYQQEDFVALYSEMIELSKTSKAKKAAAKAISKVHQYMVAHYNLESIPSIYTDDRAHHKVSYISEIMFQAILNKIDNLIMTADEKQALILALILGYRCGLRIGEIVKVRIRDVAETQNYLEVRNNKFGNNKSLSARRRVLLEQLLTESDSKLIKRVYIKRSAYKGQTLIANQAGLPYKAQAISKVLNSLIKEVTEPPRYCRRLNILREYNDENTTLHPRD